MAHVDYYRKFDRSNSVKFNGLALQLGVSSAGVMQVMAAQPVASADDRAKIAGIVKAALNLVHQGMVRIDQIEEWIHNE
jgi:hypothetical protein